MKPANQTMVSLSVDEQIDYLIETAWQALEEISVRVKVFRHSLGYSHPRKKALTVAQEGLKIFPSFDGEGEYLLARMALEEDVRLYDQVELGGFRFEVVTVSKPIRMGDRMYKDVAAKRLDLHAGIEVLKGKRS